jgi:hypothetical protein
LGRFRRGTKSIMITDAPTIDPAPPTPVRALPIMNAIDDGAEAHTIDPISKIATRTANVRFGEYKV